jgi:hypothetical protein
MVAPTREREWMDTEREEKEPYFYVWVQVEPGAPVFPIPYPLPPDLPPDAVVWTPWQGVAWDQQWVAIDGLGAIRFAGARSSNQFAAAIQMARSMERRPSPLRASP